MVEIMTETIRAGPPGRTTCPGGPVPPVLAAQSSTLLAPRQANGTERMCTGTDAKNEKDDFKAHTPFNLLQFPVPRGAIASR